MGRLGGRTLVTMALLRRASLRVGEASLCVTGLAETHGSSVPFTWLPMGVHSFLLGQLHDGEGVGARARQPAAVMAGRAGSSSGLCIV